MMFQFDIDGVFSSPSTHPSSLDKMLTLRSSKEWLLSFRCKWTTGSWPLVYGELVLSPQCTNLRSPGCIEQHKLHYSVYAWVLDMFLPQCVSRFGVNQDMMFTKDPPEFLRSSYAIGNDDVVTFSCLLFSVCCGSFSGFDKGPVLVATSFKCSPDVHLFLLLPLWLGGHGLSLMV